jgi:CHAT domain-containing protein
MVFDHAADSGWPLAVEEKEEDAGMKAILILLLLLGTGGLSCAQAQSYDALNDKGWQQWRARDYANAAKTIEQALQMAQASHDLDKQLKMQRWLSSAYELMGDTPKAIKQGEGTLTFYRQNHEHFRENDSEDEEYLLRFLGSLYVKQGNFAMGVKDLRASLALCQAPKVDCGADTGRILRDLGIGLYSSGDAKGAEQMLREAVQSSHGFNAKMVANPAEAPTSDLEMEALRWLERVLIAQHRTDEALEIAQRCRAGALSLTLATRLGGRFKEASAAPNVSQIKNIAREENATLVEYSLVYKSDPVIPLEFSDFEMLPAAELYIWVIHPSGAIDFRQANFGATGLPIAAMVKDVRNAIVSKSNASVRGKLLQQAYQLLITPIEALLPTDPQARVLFMPQDTLYLLPFAALQDSTGKYLIEKHTIASEVSLEVLQLSRQQFQRIPNQSLAVLVIGNPTMPPGYPPLPGAKKEADAVAGLLSTAALTGGQATKAAVIDRVGDARILHFATHGLLNAQEAQFSALVLAPDGVDSGFLPAIEIRSLKLHAEVAVLSACDTGEGRLTGDGVVGLGRSFVEAGVPTLVVSLWSIPDAPTAALMVEFYKNIRLGMDKAQALRMAMLMTSRQFPDPRAWAAFTVLGVPDASATLRSVHGAPAMHAAMNDAPMFSIPNGAQNYHQDQGQNFDFMTSSSMADVIAFYRQAFRSKDYHEDSTQTSIEKKSFTLAFLGPWKDKVLLVQGTDFGETRVINVGLYPKR